MAVKYSIIFSTRILPFSKKFEIQEILPFIKNFEIQDLKVYLPIRTRKICVLLNLIQEFIEIDAWLRLTFFICLQNELI